MDDLKKSPAGWLPVHWDEFRAQRSVMSKEELYLLQRAIFISLQYTARCYLLCGSSRIIQGQSSPDG